MRSGNGFKRAGRLAMLNGKYIYRQLQATFNSVFDESTVHPGGFLGAFNQQVDVAPFALIIQPGAIQPHHCLRAQHALCGAHDAVNLGGGQAHGDVI